MKLLKAPFTQLFIYCMPPSLSDYELGNKELRVDPTRGTGGQQSSLKITTTLYLVHQSQLGQAELVHFVQIQLESSSGSMRSHSIFSTENRALTWTGHL